MLRSQALTKISELVKLEDATSSRQLSCSVVRFFRTTIGLKQDPYFSAITQKKLLDPIIEVFLENGARYNLLNSVVIELMNFIRAENIKPLIHYIITDHDTKFKDINYVQTFKALKHRWKQNQEQAKENPKEDKYSNGLDTKAEENKSVPDDVDEDMFSRDSDSDEEENKKKTGGVVKKEEVDPEEEANFLQNMEELKKKKRKLDEDRNEFDFQKLGAKGKDQTKPKDDSKTTQKKSGSPPTSPKAFTNAGTKPTSPPGSGTGTYLQSENSPKRRKGSK